MGFVICQVSRVHLELEVSGVDREGGVSLVRSALSSRISLGCIATKSRSQLRQVFRAIANSSVRATTSLRRQKSL